MSRRAEPPPPLWRSTSNKAPYVYPSPTADSPHDSTPYGTPHPFTPHFPEGPPQFPQADQPAGELEGEDSARRFSLDSTDGDDQEAAFALLVGQLDKIPSVDDRLGHLQTYKCRHISTNQLVTVMQHFPSDEDKLKALQLMEPPLRRMSGREARRVLDGLSFPSGKLNALEILAGHIRPHGRQEVLEALEFPRDRSRAEIILERAR